MTFETYADKTLCAATDKWVKVQSAVLNQKNWYMQIVCM